MGEAGSDKTAERAGVPLGTRDGNPKEPGEGSQAPAACAEKAGDETTMLMEEVLRKENLMRAYKRVKSNKGSAGVDGMSVEEHMPYVAKPNAYANAGPWKSAALPGMNKAFPNKTVYRWGLKSLLDETVDLHIPCEPPCTDPYARWCGIRGRATAHSYPIIWIVLNRTF